MELIFADLNFIIMKLINEIISKITKYGNDFHQFFSVSIILNSTVQYSSVQYSTVLVLDH